MARNQMLNANELWHNLPAMFFGNRAAVGEGAAGIGLVGRRDFAPQNNPFSLPFHHGVGDGGGGEECLRIRMAWVGVQGGG